MAPRGPGKVEELIARMEKEGAPAFTSRDLADAYPAHSWWRALSPAGHLYPGRGVVDPSRASGWFRRLGLHPGHGTTARLVTKAIATATEGGTPTTEMASWMGGGLDRKQLGAINRASELAVAAARQKEQAKTAADREFATGLSRSLLGQDAPSQSEADAAALRKLALLAPLAGGMAGAMSAKPGRRIKRGLAGAGLGGLVSLLLEAQRSKTSGGLMAKKSSAVMHAAKIDLVGLLSDNPDIAAALGLTALAGTAGAALGRPGRRLQTAAKAALPTAALSTLAVAGGRGLKKRSRNKAIIQGIEAMKAHGWVERALLERDRQSVDEGMAAGAESRSGGLQDEGLASDMPMADRLQLEAQLQNESAQRASDSIQTATARPGSVRPKDWWAGRRAREGKVPAVSETVPHESISESVATANRIAGVAHKAEPDIRRKLAEMLRDNPDIAAGLGATLAATAGGALGARKGRRVKGALTSGGVAALLSALGIGAWRNRVGPDRANAAETDRLRSTVQPEKGRAGRTREGWESKAADERQAEQARQNVRETGRLGNMRREAQAKQDAVQGKVSVGESISAPVTDEQVQQGLAEKADRQAQAAERARVEALRGPAASRQAQAQANYNPGEFTLGAPTDEQVSRMGAERAARVEARRQAAKLAAAREKAKPRQDAAQAAFDAIQHTLAPADLPAALLARTQTKQGPEVARAMADSLPRAEQDAALDYGPDAAVMKNLGRLVEMNQRAEEGKPVIGLTPGMVGGLKALTPPKPKPSWDPSKVNDIAVALGLRPAPKATTASPAEIRAAVERLGLLNP